jgi:hypothetical protein
MNFPATVTNGDIHFAPGDLASWSGIKRCGAAIMMGHLTAINIHQLILRTPEERNSLAEPKTDEIAYALYPEVSPMIAIAVGKKAAIYSEEEGAKSSSELMNTFFGNDLAWSIIWNWLRLGERIEAPAILDIEKLQIEADAESKALGAEDVVSMKTGEIVA